MRGSIHRLERWERGLAGANSLFWMSDTGDQESVAGWIAESDFEQSERAFGDLEGGPFESEDRYISLYQPGKPTLLKFTV